MTSIPPWLLPVIERLQQYAKESPAIINYGVFDVIEELSNEGDVAIGINYGFGNYSYTTCYINRNLMGSDCAVVCWMFKGHSTAEQEVHNQAFFDAPTVTDKIANLIWTRYANLHVKSVVPRLSLIG